MEVDCASIDNIPEEVFEYILSLLPPYNDLDNCKLVCKKWNKCVKNVIYRKKFIFNRAIQNTDLAWTTVLPPTDNLSKRYSHNAIIYGNQMFVFGGCTKSQTMFNDLWSLNLSNRTWSRLITSGSYPPPKAWATCVEYQGKLYLFGGWSHPPRFAIGWTSNKILHEYDIESNKWSVVNYSEDNELLPLGGHTATIHDNKMFIFGGLETHMQTIQHSYCRAVNNVWSYNFTTKRWNLHQTTVLKPEPRYSHSQMYIDNKRFLIYGGWSGSLMLDNIWLLVMSEPEFTWTKVEVTNPYWVEQRSLWCNPATRVGDKVVVLNKSPQAGFTTLPFGKIKNVSTPLPKTEKQLDLDVNVNGRRGSFESGSQKRRNSTDPSSSKNENNGKNCNEKIGRPIIIRTPELDRTIMAAFRIPKDLLRRSSEQLTYRQRQLEALDRAEARLNLTRQLKNSTNRQNQSVKNNGNNNSSQSQRLILILDISQIIAEPNSKPVCSWIESKEKDNSLNQNNSGQLSSLMQYSMTVGHGEILMFGGIHFNTVSNTLYVIHAPQTNY